MSAKIKMPKFFMPKLDFFVNLLNQRSERQKQLIIGFVVVLVLFLDFALLVKPTARILFEDVPKIAPLKQELKGLIEDHKNKDEIQKKWEELKLSLKERNSVFISQDETPALLENLSKQAQESGVKITSLEPSGDAAAPSKGSCAPLPIEIKANAGTHELGKFLSNLETGRTFFRVKDLRISANTQSERKHQIDLSLEAYKIEK